MGAGFAPVGEEGAAPWNFLLSRRLGGREVDCIAPQWVVRFHDRYAGDENDRADVRALCDRFDLEVPEQYR